MKNVAVAFTCALLIAVALNGQTSGKQSATPVASGKSDAGSNEDLNIRAYIQLLRADLRKQATQIVGQVMQLDSGDAAKFWPVYKDFEADQAKIGDQMIALLKNYTDHYDQVTGPVADELVSQLLSIQEQRIGLKRKYYDRLKQALDPVNAARFVQVVNQLDNLMDLQIAAQLPVVR